MNNSNSPHTMYCIQAEVSNHYRFFLDNLLQEGSEIHAILNALHDASELDTLELRINSAGGYVKHGQQFINVIKDKFKGRTATILEAQASSMAALMFVAGDRRIIYPHSVLMIHEVSMFTDGKASESKRQIDVTIRVMKEYISSLFEGMVTPEEIDRVCEGTDYWFDATDMCVRGIATDVMVNGSSVTAEQYLVSKGLITLEEESEAE